MIDTDVTVDPSEEAHELFGVSLSPELVRSAFKMGEVKSTMEARKAELVAYIASYKEEDSSALKFSELGQFGDRKNAEWWSELEGDAAWEDLKAARTDLWKGTEVPIAQLAQIFPIVEETAKILMGDSFIKVRIPGLDEMSSRESERILASAAFDRMIEILEFHGGAQLSSER